MGELNQQIIRKTLRSIQTGDIEVIKGFRKSHPDVHWSEIRYPKSGSTILHLTARLGYAEIVDYLLTSYTPSGVDCRDRDGKTALHEAAQFARLEVMKVLLYRGAEVDALKRADWTPLMLACTKGESKDNGTDRNKCVELLLSYRANYLLENKDGWTAFHLCSREGLEDALLTLTCCKCGYSEKELESHNGRTSLHVAAIHGHNETAEMILTYAANINKKDNCGHTPIHDAIIGGNMLTFIRFIYAGANLDDVTCEGFTILHIAASYNRLNFMEYILEQELADINCLTEKSRLTPLHCAARNKQSKSYEWLLQRGAQTDLKDSFGRLAADYWNI